MAMSGRAFESRIFWYLQSSKFGHHEVKGFLLSSNFIDGGVTDERRRGHYAGAASLA